MNRSPRTALCFAVTAAAALLAPQLSQALAQSHYPIGVEGVKAATLPPPGLYLRDYNLFYFADQVNDPSGDEIPVDFDVFVYAQAPRLIWITDLQLLGGNYGMDVLVPFLYTDLSAPGYEGDCFALGDVFFEPITLSWHWQKFDLGVGYGFWAPLGEYDVTQPAQPGKGFWSNMFTLGATWYPDQEKTWSLSALARYEIHTEQEDTDITPGNTLSLEAGLAKALAPTFEVGVVGYYQQQTTEDDGDGASDDLERVLAVGPEVVWVCPKWALFTSLRYFYEFDAQDRPQGHTVTLTLTKKF